MNLALILMGVLCGVALSATVALFGVLSMGGRFRDNLRDAGAEGCRRLTGRHRGMPVSTAVRNADGDVRVRALQEEVKVMQRLMEQARSERQSHAESLTKASEEIAALRASLADRDEKIAAAETPLREAGALSTRLREALAERAAELAGCRRELKDLQTELSVAASGAGLSSISEEIARLRLERDALQARLEHLQAVGPAASGRNLSFVL